MSPPNNSDAKIVHGEIPAFDTKDLAKGVDIDLTDHNDSDDVISKQRIYGDYLELPEGLPDEGSAFTFRAVAIGTLLGSIVGASNIYLGLKTGFTFAASLFGAIFGFALLKPLSKVAGGYFGPKENCTVQTAATAAGGLSTLFVATLPAMYHLNLLSPSQNPKDDLGKIFLLTFITAYYGLFFGVPLRKYFIIKQKLVFPTPFASANTIASLHSVGGEAEGKFKAKVMAWSMLIGILTVVFGYFIPGIKTWHIFSKFFASDVFSSELI